MAGINDLGFTLTFNGMKKFQLLSLYQFSDINALKCWILSEQGLSTDEYYILCNGQKTDNDEAIKGGCCYCVIPRVLGGKGGFGSMLRAIGAQIEKTTNREACRDLSGRRMRDVNNEKKLKGWIAKRADKERECERIRQERISKRRAMPHHKFDDPLYEQQRKQVSEELETALQQGLNKSLCKPSTSSATVVSGRASRKRKTVEAAAGVKKKCEWIGVEVDSLTDSSEETEALVQPEVSVLAKATDDSVNTESEHYSTGCEYEEKDQAESSLGRVYQQSLPENSSQDHLQVCSVDKAGLLDSSLPHVDKCDFNEKKEIRNFNLDDYNTAAELEDLGLDQLKSILMERGLKCGGTLQQRAQRLFSIKGLSKDQISPNLFAKPKKW